MNLRFLALPAKGLPLPIVHSFHPEQNVVVSVWTGQVPDAEAIEAYRELYSHDAWYPGIDELADLSNCDFSKISTDGLRSIAKLVREAMKGSGKEFRTAIIAPDDLVREARAWVSSGVRVLGGCCGLGPQHVSALADAFS